MPFMARPPPIRVGNLLRLLEEFLSTPSPPESLWRRLLGHLSSLTFLVPDGMLRMRLLQLCLKDQWDFLDDQFQVSWSPLCREYLLWWARVAQLREGISFSLPTRRQPLIGRFGCGLEGPHRRTPRLGPLVSSSADSLHHPERASSSSVRPEGLRTPVGGPVGSSVLRQHHHSSATMASGNPSFWDLPDRETSSGFITGLRFAGSRDGCPSPTLRRSPSLCLSSDRRHKESACQVRSSKNCE